MTASDRKIAEFIRSLAAKQFDEVLDWEVCYDLVVRVISRSRLPASQYAPQSRYGGSEWIEDDYLAIAGEWCTDMLDHGAPEIVGLERTDQHIANAAKQSIRQFVIDRVKGHPRGDLWKSLKEALKDFEKLLDGDAITEVRVPDSSFPYQGHKRGSRQRCFSAPEIRDALAIISRLFPTGWTRMSLFNCLQEWTGVGDGKFVSLDIEREKGGSASSELVDKYLSLQLHSFTLGMEEAAKLLGNYSETERRIIQEYVIPNKLGLVTRDEASEKLGIAGSTLSDRGKRLWTQLEDSKLEETAVRDAEWKRGFFSQLLDESFGIWVGDLGTDSLESDQ